MLVLVSVLLELETTYGGVLQEVDYACCETTDTRSTKINLALTLTAACPLDMTATFTTQEKIVGKGVEVLEIKWPAVEHGGGRRVTRVHG